MAICGASAGLNAQNVGIKSNLLTDALLSPNVGVEVGLAPKWTLELTGEVNAWGIKDHKWKHWFLQPEARYWFCQRFGGHFVGLHALGGQFNLGHLGINIGKLKHLLDNRYQGWGVGAGVAYGYAWPVAKHWNIEAEIGLGWMYTRYDRFKCAGCGKKVSSDRSRNFFTPTKAAVSVEYLF